MRIQCKNCGAFFTVDQQDVADHIGLCDRCLSSFPKKAEYQADQFQVRETKAEKAARQKKELEEAKLTEESKIISTGNTPPTGEGFVPGVLAEPVPSEDQGVQTGEGAPVETISEKDSSNLPMSEE